MMLTSSYYNYGYIMWVFILVTMTKVSCVGGWKETLTVEHLKCVRPFGLSFITCPWKIFQILKPSVIVVAVKTKTGKTAI